MTAAPALLRAARALRAAADLAAAQLAAQRAARALGYAVTARLRAEDLDRALDALFPAARTAAALLEETAVPAPFNAYQTVTGRIVLRRPDACVLDVAGRFGCVRDDDVADADRDRLDAGEHTVATLRVAASVARAIGWPADHDAPQVQP